MFEGQARRVLLPFEPAYWGNPGMKWKIVLEELRSNDKCSEQLIDGRRDSIRISSKRIYIPF
jgi:hypothetical protein